MPFGAVVETLRGLGFDGVLSVECRLRGDPAEAVRGCGRYLRLPPDYAERVYAACSASSSASTSAGRSRGGRTRRS